MRCEGENSLQRRTARRWLLLSFFPLHSCSAEPPGSASDKGRQALLGETRGEKHARKFDDASGGVPIVDRGGLALLLIRITRRTL